MEDASATRLRFKGSATPSSKKRKHSDSYQHRKHLYFDSHTNHSSSSSRTTRRSRSRSRSPKRSSKDKEDNQRRSKHKSRGHSRSRSHSPSSSSRSRSSRYKVTPAGFAPDSLDSYCFDDGEDLERAYHLQMAREMRANELEKQQVEEEAADDPWLSHLFDEMANDDPYAYHSGRFSTQTSSGSGRKHDKVQSLSDDAYTSYMRKGMGRTPAQKEFLEWTEWVEEQEQRKYKDARMEQKRRDEERSRRRQERRERERLDEETEANARTGIGSHQTTDDTPASRLRKRALVDQARGVYEEGWKALLVEDSQDTSATTTATTIPHLSLLSMDNIPWPPLHGTLESTDVSDVQAAGSVLSLFDFLFFGTTADQTDVRKQLLRREQLRFHPDKFKQRFGARLPPSSTSDGATSSLPSSSSSSAAAVGAVPGERERILEQVDKVARALNELGEMF
ncbi:hypothetical protein BGW39_006938 [Mortierella sp. 14UC]|nr:hypothetical protein BGW39_006938 [Mortierella sp. 14UC]